jgi:hypothetical protein
LTGKCVLPIVEFISEKYPGKRQKRSRENISERYFTQRTIKAGKNQKYNTSGNITG